MMLGYVKNRQPVLFHSHPGLVNDSTKKALWGISYLTRGKNSLPEGVWNSASGQLTIAGRFQSQTEIPTTRTRGIIHPSILK